MVGVSAPRSWNTGGLPVPLLTDLRPPTSDLQLTSDLYLNTTSMMGVFLRSLVASRAAPSGR